MPFLLPSQVQYKKTGNRSKDISALRSKYGSNALPAKAKTGFFKKYLASFGDPIIKILLAALALNLIIAIRNMELYEPLGIAIALFLATFVSALSEYGSESAFIRLEKQAAATVCRVIRDGKLETLPARELVVNDLLVLSAGERVPADAVVVEGRVLVDQSSLSGESAELEKTAGDNGGEWELGSPTQIFSGSVITSGECLAAVGRTGENSLYGALAGELSKTAEASPLTKRLSKLASVLARIGYVAAALVFFADLFNGVVIDNGFDSVRIVAELCSLPIMLTNLLHALTLAITVVVVAVPEGLPMMITVVLSSNMKRLRRDNVLVRKLVGIETCGCVNMLFCDKTGTLTGGKLEVVGFYDRYGEYRSKPTAETLQDTVRCCLLSNESTLIKGRAVGGNATDRALLGYAALKLCGKKETPDKKLPFNSTDKLAAASKDGVFYVKGAPEVILKGCAAAPSLTNRLTELTKSGARVLALAKSRDMQRFELIGLLAVSDKLRADARRSVGIIKNAGISVCMVTGDNVDTAVSVASACGILGEGGKVITSEQMSHLTDSELAGILPRLSVVARALPTDKSRLIRVSKSIGCIPAMTGDGINDAPALSQADVGFAMGSGTEVAKDAGDIVILDDSLASIAKAILYGRTIFKSIRKFIVFQLTMNLCAVGVSVIGPFIGIDTPITVMQMLWINIIMDTLAGLAFAGEPPLARYMTERPISREEPVLSRGMSVRILFMGGYSLVLCIAFLTLGVFRARFGASDGGLRFMTAFFLLFVLSGVFGCLCARSERKNLLAGIFRNKSFVMIFFIIIAVTLMLVYNGGEMFRTSPLPLSDLVLISALAFSVVPADFLRKTVLRIEY